jgi:flagellar M-ring protein FliF
MEPLQRLLAQLRTFWTGLGTARKVALVGFTVLVFAALAAFAVLSTGAAAEYRPLFSNLQPEEIQPIITRLQAANVPYRLPDTADGVLVPTTQYAQARVLIAGDATLPLRGGKGYEIFDETSLGSTPFVQQVNLQRAIQTELGRFIEKLEPVQSARVLVAKPESSPFIRDQRPPTASVVLTLKPGATVNGATAANIVSLVARSVDGLKPENVTVVDSQGRLLSDPHAADRDSLPAAQLQFRTDWERELAAKAEDVLTATLGRGRAVVKVSADINFQKVKERQETFLPEGKVPSAERNSTSSTTGTGRAGGVVGARSNLPPVGGSPVTPAGGVSTSKEEVNHADYNVSRTTRDVEGDRATLQRLNVAAVIDLSPPEGGAGPTMTVAEVEDLIKKAVGFNAGRGDEIKVTNARLGSPVAAPAAEGVEDEAAKFQRLQNYVSLARNISLAVAVVLAVALVPLIALRRRPRPEPKPAEPPPGPTPEQRRAEQLAKLREMATADPGRVAEVLTMLAGGKP